MPSEDITRSVADANLKNLGDQPTFHSNLAATNALSHQQAVNTIVQQSLNSFAAVTQASTGAIVKALTEVDPIEAISTVKSMTGQDLAQQLAGLVAALAGGQQSAKVGQTTPPPTA